MAYSDAELLALLQEFAAEHGRPPTATEAADHDDLPTAAAYHHRFGSWNAALTDAGLEPRPSWERRSNEELLADLRALADEHGKYPSKPTVNDHDEMASAATYQQRFGSWSAAIAAAGLPTFTRPSYSETDLIETLQRLADELGRPPRVTDIDSHPEVATHSTYINRFGSWNAALAAADLATREDAVEANDNH